MMSEMEKVLGSKEDRNIFGLFSFLYFKSHLHLFLFR